MNKEEQTIYDTIDWSIFEEYPLSTINCKCGEEFYSYTKLKLHKDSFIHFSKDPCPKCGKYTDMKKCSSPPERMII